MKILSANFVSCSYHSLSIPACIIVLLIPNILTIKFYAFAILGIILCAGSCCLTQLQDSLPTHFNRLSSWPPIQSSAWIKKLSVFVPPFLQGFLDRILSLIQSSAWIQKTFSFCSSFQSFLDIVEGMDPKNFKVLFLLSRLPGYCHRFKWDGRKVKLR